MSLHQRGLGVGIGINEPGRLKHLAPGHEIAVAALVLASPTQTEPIGFHNRADAVRFDIFAAHRGPRGLFDDRRSYARGRRLLRLCAATLATLRRLHREADRQN